MKSRVPRRRLVVERVKRGLTQEQVAKAIDSRQNSICAIETGERNPSFSMMKRLADFYGLTVDELFFGEDYHESGCDGQRAS